jgi:D-sedoheptulose 7-phosphate isomerase
MELIKHIDEHIEVIKKSFDSSFIEKIEKAGYLISDRINQGGKVILMGNGGSAADCQHIAAEFISKLSKDRIPLPAIALTVDTSAITAISNDYGYKNIFSRQLLGLCNSNDVIIGISTSGTSNSIIHGFKTAEKIGAFTIGLSGENKFLDFEPDLILNVSSHVTARIQEVHILIGHLLCGVAEKPYV